MREYVSDLPLSDAQKQAVYSDCDMIVSAGAGCGKTYTMIERIIRKLVAGDKNSDGVSLDSMLIVTYTRAAAADIRVKLATRLNRLRLKGEREKRVADEALAAMPVCDIGTLDSFCQRLIRTYFYAADIQPSATIADEREAALIKTACVKKAIVDAWKSGDSDFIEIYNALGSRRDDGEVVKALENILDFALCARDPFDYLGGGMSDAEALSRLEGIVRSRRDGLIPLVAELRLEAERVGLNSVLKGIDAFIDYVDGRMSELPRVQYRRSDKDSPAVACEKSAVNERYKTVKKKCEQLRAFSARVGCAASVDGARYSRALLSVARAALDEYNRRKKALEKIDYSDLEHGACRVLCDESCRREISSRIKYVFIDEFQDVNPLQASIADLLRECGAEMFLVGDIKQSIYGFRRCSPEYFARKLRPENGYTAVYLNENHRSDKKIIDFVNAVFEPMMTESFGGVDYALHELVGTSIKDGSADFYIIDDIIDGQPKQAADGTTAAENGENARSGREVYSVIGAREKISVDPEAAYVVGRIAKLIDEHKDDDKFSLGQIAVLVRSVGGFAYEVMRLLSQNGIRACIGKRSKLSDYPEALALVDIARYVDNRFDDVALYTALRSPMGMFSDAELFELATEGQAAARYKKVPPERGRAYSFRQKVDAYRGRFSDRLNAFFALRDEFSRYAKCHDASDSLGYITSRISYFGHVCEYYGSAGRSADSVEALISAARIKTDLHSFIKFCDETDFNLDVGTGGDAVVISSIHASKGLEYDYCFVCELGHKFRYDDVRGKVIVSEHGVALKVPTVAGDGKPVLAESAPWLLANAEGIGRLDAEELRLLYVALTRAKKALVVTGRRKKQASPSLCALRFMSGVPALAAQPIPVSAERAVRLPPSNADAVRDAVSRVCAFEYGSTALPVKTCVTALVTEDDDDYTSAAPVLTRDDSHFDPSRDNRRSAREKSADGAETARLRGTAFHRAMELMDLSSPDFDVVADRCEHIELVDRDLVLEAANVMRGLIGNDRYFKERYFMADLEFAGGNVLVQGVIDLLILRGDGTATIVDYKTGELSGEALAEYKKQVEYYARAVERATGMRVAERYLYSFTGGLVRI